MTQRFNPLLAKVGCIAAVTLLLLIPLRQVESLIAERASLRDAAVERIAHGVGQAQSIGGLMLIVPVTRTQLHSDKTVFATSTLHILADSTAVQGSVSTQKRHSGIYNIPTYQAKLHLQGSISNDLLLRYLADELGVVKTIGTPKLFLAISDPSGIRVLDGIRVNGELLQASAAEGAPVRGVWADLPALRSTTPQTFTYSVDVELSGTERIRLLPFAATTTVSLSSAWPSPSFSGAFAPNATPLVDAHGFAAKWSVLQLNRDYPQAWSDEQVSAAQLGASAFGVDFYQPVDAYQRDYRAIHYAVLFIALTFLTLFLVEYTVGPRVHVMQYAMLGAALSVFYLVLLALSEHMVFWASYSVAALAMSVLLGLYFSGVLRSRPAGAAAGAITGSSYALLYLLVLSEEYALLFGALALFAVVAAIMIGTRRLDWYSLPKRSGAD